MAGRQEWQGLWLAEGLCRTESPEGAQLLFSEGNPDSWWQSLLA